ncbi:hypothetical protein PIROE2DRAFT_19448 [Piromyces sp. E2]|nr:hypothetical protein PIROE2DRAFT_19448 [Piromyces sp. E2]|eukprot:OUM56103.1 hypothetical protein PIROE2DRAFT_19448 [Piromyces sp. E2]
MVVVILLSLFIIFSRDQNIIKDIGLFKILIYSVGMIMIFISNLLSTYMDYIECSYNYLFKCYGFALLIVAYYSYVFISMELGVYNHNDEKFKVIANGFLSQIGAKMIKVQSVDSFKSENESREYDSKFNQEMKVNILRDNKRDSQNVEEINKNIELKLMNMNSHHTNRENKMINHMKNSPSTNYMNMMNKLKNVYKRVNSDDISLDSSNNEKIDNMKIIENIIKANHSFLKEIFFINMIYDIIVLILIVSQEINDDDSINFIQNSKKDWVYHLYLILKKQGNDPKKYFIFERKRNDSNILFSYESKKNEKEKKFLMQSFIGLYRYSSKIFEIKNGKLKYVGSTSTFDVSILNPSIP